MTVAFSPEGTRIGGMTRTEDDSVTFAISCRGNSDASGLVLQLAYDPGFILRVPGTYTDGSATSTANFNNTAWFKGAIDPNRTVYWRSQLNGVGGPITGTVAALHSGSFKSPPRKDCPRTWTIGVMGCSHLQLNTTLETNRYRDALLRNFADLSPDGFIHVGDINYFDTGPTVYNTPLEVGQWIKIDSDNALSDASVTAYRTDWITTMAYALPPYEWHFGRLCATRPVWVVRDDHCLSSANNPPMPETSAGSWQEAARSTAFPALHEYMLGLNQPLVEQTHTYSRNYLAPADHHKFDMYPVRFLMLAPRDYHVFGRPDTPAKPLVDALGSEQEAWFRSEISAFAATSVKDMPFLCIVSAVDWDGSHGWTINQNSTDNWQASTYAREELFDILWNAGIGHRVFTITGDTHNTSVAYYQKTKAHPKIWAFMASHGVTIGGHEQTTGWGSRLLGFDYADPVGWGGVPVVNLAGINGWNNALQVSAGVDRQGPWAKCKVWWTWPRETNEHVGLGVVPKPGFCKTFRITRRS